MKNILLIAAFVVALFGCKHDEFKPVQKEWFIRKQVFSIVDGQPVIAFTIFSPEHARIVRDSVYLFTYQGDGYLNSFYNPSNIDHRAKLNQLVPRHNQESLKGRRELYIYFQKDSLLVKEVNTTNTKINIHYEYYVPVTQ
jgi:hypothetical protein